jgi:hypothetical protein
MNSEARDLGTEEVFRGPGAQLVSFDNSASSGFVEEYLTDIADLDDNGQVRLGLIFP